MDIKIRNLSEDIVTKLNSMAKKKGLSREGFLREQLELIAESNKIKSLKEREEILLERVIKVIDINSRAVSIFLKENGINIERVLEDE